MFTSIFLFIILTTFPDDKFKSHIQIFSHPFQRVRADSFETCKPFRIVEYGILSTVQATLRDSQNTFIV